MFDLLITNGQVISPSLTINVDIAVEGEKIVALLTPGTAVEAKRVIDAAGQYVIPGAIDPHVHLDHEFMGFKSGHDFETGGMVAAFGGTTMLIDFAFQEVGGTAQAAIEARWAQAEGQATIDYSLHCGLADASERTLAEVDAIVEAGIPSFKLILVNRENHIDDGAMLAIFRRLKEVRGLAGIHGENAAIVEYEVNRHLKAGQQAAYYHPQSRPAFVEAESIRRAIYLAQVAGAGLYAFHISAAESMEALKQARDAGQPIYGETCPHYLMLNDEVYSRADGINFIMTPPLRGVHDQMAMWHGLERDIFSIVGSDECTFPQEAKVWGRESFDKVPAGVPGLETRLPIVFSEGVMKGRFSINRMVELLCTNPARVFGCYPQKGIIAPGSDADIVLLDPNKQVTWSPEWLHTDIDYSPYDGLTLTGYPTMTIARGQVIVEEGQFFGKPGAGRFIERQISAEILAGPK